MQDDEDGEVELPIEPDDDADNVATAQTEAPSDPATEAFTRLEHQLALMRRAVEHLAAERADIVIPDYGATLSGMTTNLAAVDESLKAIGQMPALQFTLVDMGKRIEQTARSARSDYEATIQQWRTAACGLERSLSEALGSAARRDEQVRRERWFFGAGAAVAAALMSLLPGIIARELPANWQLPEQMARRTLGEPTVLDAGIRLIRSENPPMWAAISDATATYGANRVVIERCKEVARKAGKAVNCQVLIDR